MIICSLKALAEAHHRPSLPHALGRVCSPVPVFGCPAKGLGAGFLGPSPGSTGKVWVPRFWVSAFGP